MCELSKKLKSKCKLHLISRLTPPASPRGEAFNVAFPLGGRAPVCEANKYAGGIFKVLCGFAAGEMPDVNQASTTPNGDG